MTKFFIDSDNGLDTNDGLAIGTAYKTMNRFTETARSPGDIAVCRRVASARYDDGGPLDFTSSGDASGHLTIEADYENEFGDDVVTAGETYTTVFGSKVITASATPDAAIVAGKWIYVSTDDAREFAYEVESVSGNDITLFLPFKGTTGSGLTLVVMGSSPIWGASSAFGSDINLTSDDFWAFQGIGLRTSTSATLLDMVTCGGLLFKDCAIETTSATEIFDGASDMGEVFVLKTRFFSYENILDGQSGTFLYFKDCLFDGNNVGQSLDSTVARGKATLIECEFKNHISSDMRGPSASRGAQRWLRNCIFGSTTEYIQVGNLAQPGMEIFIEDYDGVPGVSAQHNFRSPSNTTLIQKSDTGTLRSGGGDRSILISPSLQLNINEVSRYRVFEYPIITTTVSKTYTIYFKSNATGDWIVSPTAAQCWLELEAWGHPTNNFRKITKSAGALDFTTDANYDQTLSVTVAPAKAGVAYFRLYYGKPKESGKNNFFFIDPKVVIT